MGKKVQRVTDADKARNMNHEGGKRHEPDRFSLSAVSLCIVVLLLLIVGVQPIVAWLLGMYRDAEDQAAELTAFEPGSARHWNDPAGDLAALRKEEDRRLNEYGWIDRRQGVVRIPIERAIEILAANGGSPPRGTDVQTDTHKPEGSTDEGEQ